jgi:hypothetical protein
MVLVRQNTAKVGHDGSEMPKIKPPVYSNLIASICSASYYEIIDRSADCSRQKNRPLKE